MIYIKHPFNKNRIELVTASFQHLKEEAALKLSFGTHEFYLLHNGKILSEQSKIIDDMEIGVSLRLVGGKGGFGSMLRAIGAQIEKTTNREACRDLSGRRLRDINEEKRLKNWIASQSDRDREAQERKQRKLERLCVEPKHKFEDTEYEKQRSELPDKVSDAVEQGFQKATILAEKRKREDEERKNKKLKKAKLWVDAELSGSDASSGTDDEEESKPSTSGLTSTQTTVSCVK